MESVTEIWTIEKNGKKTVLVVKSGILAIIFTLDYLMYQYAAYYHRFWCIFIIIENFLS